MKHIKQFRYYGNENASNYPVISNYRLQLINGNIFKNHGQISQLGIQGVPGTKFYLNNSENPIIIGGTGIYELDLGDSGAITAIRFDSESIDIYDNSEIERMLIDIVYEGMGE